MKSGLKLIFITLPALALGGGLLVYIIMNRHAPAQLAVAERATAVRIVKAEEIPLAPRITGYGLVRPTRVFEAIPEVGATADYVNPHLEKGAILPKGTVLLKLSPADFKLAVAQAKANIRAAQAKLDELQISRKNQLAALAIERESLVIKSRDLERVKKLVASGTNSQAALDAGQASWLVQQQKVLNLKNSLALLPTTREVQQEQIAVNQSRLKTAELNLARTTLTLPFTARVSQSTVQVGQFVRAGQVAASLDGVGSAEVAAQVSINDMLGLHRADPAAQAKPAISPEAMTRFLHDMGLRAVVHLRLGKQTLSWPATVDRISDTIDQKSGTLGVIVRIKTAYSGAKPGQRPPLTKGMFVAVTLSTPAIKGIVIPRSALRHGKVLIADADNRLRRRAVTARLVQGEVALITRGLKPGERVVVSAPSPVIEGMLLQASEDKALESALRHAGQVK